MSIRTLTTLTVALLIVALFVVYMGLRDNRTVYVDCEGELSYVGPCHE